MEGPSIVPAKRSADPRSNPRSSFLGIDTPTEPAGTHLTLLGHAHVVAMHADADLAC